ncbi:hypothetical protein, unlikely [Trypanosoma brucei gambiense DAL972]|uniref:Uncharacterized protein n=1 Tax=Trypanosoma brucei gambiense (strain MHOM/CI/86/DAL972) TaxID=679716 RepID=C9ZQ87_TRYB9|nr:hypothetical protein, unlikely [Trypanosoma brucei gambiense DAL972]CBH11567.1 hypothetical protein, unlikely [Trypanosoma brucei gambiense DAL972]|eukprot:XP_011773852.1 hypothetical protein, unlikely [Trypanosoma brucei gambiense DAL972]
MASGERSVLSEYHPREADRECCHVPQQYNIRISGRFFPLSFVQVTQRSVSTLFLEGVSEHFFAYLWCRENTTRRSSSVCFGSDALPRVFCVSFSLLYHHNREVVYVPRQV